MKLVVLLVTSVYLLVLDSNCFNAAVLPNLPVVPDAALVVPEVVVEKVKTANGSGLGKHVDDEEEEIKEIESDDVENGVEVHDQVDEDDDVDAAVQSANLQEAQLEDDGLDGYSNTGQLHLKQDFGKHAKNEHDDEDEDDRLVEQNKKEEDDENFDDVESNYLAKQNEVEVDDEEEVEPVSAENEE